MRQERLLTAADVVEAAGIAARELQTWCEQGALVPVEGGGGTGKFRRFTVMQTLGIAVACKVRQSPRGCVLGYVRMLVDAFGVMDEERLRKHFAKRQTHLAYVGPNGLILSGNEYDRVDVAATYNEVTARIAEIEQRFAGFVGGRPRGLARAATG
jgi:DNA-binding transcriptional MerR regulator